MKFHGRMHPGRLRDLGEPVEVRIHQPLRAADVTIKIWELDAFLGADGKPRREGTPDDLLATFTGAIEPAPRGKGARPPEWRQFKVSSVKVEDAPPDVMKFLLRFPGAETVYEIPIISEDVEVEGTEYELGFSIEVGGSEKFRTRAPCLVATRRVVPRVRQLIVLGHDDDGEPIREDVIEVPVMIERLALARAAPDEDDPSATLAVRLRARIHPSGFLVADQDGEAAPLGLNLARALVAVPYGNDQDPGMPAAVLGHVIADDGTIEVIRPDLSFTRTMLVAGTSVEAGSRGGDRHVTFAGQIGERATDVPPLATREIAAAKRPRAHGRKR
jgi:hypothetical protein